jgi:glycosyltransferase involved in cell wall biosynthesis
MNESSHPKVTVCTPVYNGSDYIAESIQSVLDQTYKNFNLIVCDNCSTDNTEEIVRNFNDPRLTYVRNKKNIGLVANHNRCLELADGEYVNFLHHDDIMLPDNLALKVSILDEHPNVGLVHSGVLFMDKDGEQLDRTWSIAKNDYIEDGIKVFEKYIMNMPVGASFFIGAVLARRDCYLKIGNFNPLLPSVIDNEMWMRFLLFFDVACIGKPLVIYRLHDEMASSSLGDLYGLNLQGLEDHYLASNMVIEQYKSRIPQWKNLKRRVNTDFSMKAARRGALLFRDRKLTESITAFKNALKFYPLVFTKKVFWAFIWTLIIKQVQKISKSIVAVDRQDK